MLFCLVSFPVNGQGISYYDAEIKAGGQILKCQVSSGEKEQYMFRTGGRWITVEEGDPYIIWTSGQKIQGVKKRLPESLMKACVKKIPDRNVARKDKRATRLLATTSKKPTPAKYGMWTGMEHFNWNRVKLAD